MHLIYSEQVAGAEKYLLNLLPGLKDSGIDCRLICVTPPADQIKFIGFCDALNQKGVEAILIKGSKPGFLRVARFIHRYLRDNNIGYLHAHLFKSDLLAVMVKKFFNRKLFLISTKHGYQEKYLSKYPANNGKIDHDIYYFLSRYICRNTDQQVTISKAMSDLYYDLKLTRERMHYIYHGVSISPLGSKYDNEQPVNEEYHLVVVGRIEFIKGHQYLFKAMPAVMEKFPGIKLRIIGNGTQKESLLEQASVLGIDKNIEFLGFQEDPGPVMSSSDIIVLPSLFEPFGLVYLEALALRVPIVAFDVPACNEIVSNNETGLLVPVYDSAALAQKIIYLLENPAEKIRLAENGYLKYTSYYSTARMIKDTLAWYRSIIQD